MSDEDYRIEPLDKHKHNATLTKEEKETLLRAVLPACQPQEGSPANTFTSAELDDLQRALPNVHISIRKKDSNRTSINSNKIDIRDLELWAVRPQVCTTDSSSSTTHGLEEKQLLPKKEEVSSEWYGAAKLHPNVHISRNFRDQVRTGKFTSPTNGVCPGFLQCNLVVLPEGRVAFDFLLFCQRNPKACPLIEVCDAGSPFPFGVASGADLRTDVPKYAIYRNGKLEKEVTDATPYWPENAVAFLIGCSFSYDKALLDAGIRLKSAEQGKNVPMYRTNIKCRSAGSLHGTMVVSMKPIHATMVAKHIEITSKYTHAHGGPVSVGSASAIGIADIDKPEWGDCIDISAEEVPVFHACGVTPQNILMESKVSFAITHSAGHMFVTDLPSDMGV